MIPQDEAGIGLEILELLVTTILYEELNDEIDIQQAKWEDRDDEWQALTGQEGFTTLEYIDSENFYSGHRPSLVKHPIPIDKYPNVSVMAYQARPAVSIIDQASNFTNILDIEILVKGENETEANRRCHRTTEAVHQVLSRNEDLQQFSQGFDNDPVVNHTDTFIYSHNEKDIFWRACRLRYDLTRHSSLS